MASQQTTIANPANKTHPPLDKSSNSLFPEVNLETIQQLHNATTTSDVNKAIDTAFKKLEEKYGRPLTYAEMRMEMG